MSKETAVEWLVEQYEKSFNLQINKVMITIIEQAKQMEKEQIIDTYIEASENPALISEEALDDAEQYYQQTFNKE